MKQSLKKLIIFFFCFSICLSTPSHAQFKFSQIKVQGNSNTDVETIKSISGLKRNISLSSNDLNLALKNLYNSNLFESVQVIPKGQTILIKGSNSLSSIFLFPSKAKRRILLFSFTLIKTV